jgi:hypothetical protein
LRTSARKLIKYVRPITSPNTIRDVHCPTVPLHVEGLLNRRARTYAHRLQKLPFFRGVDGEGHARLLRSLLPKPITARMSAQANSIPQRSEIGARTPVPCV